MTVSCHELVRDFLKDWKDPEAIQETILRLTLADNPQSGRLRRLAEMHYGPMTDSSHQAAFLSDCIQDLLARRDALLHQAHFNCTFLISLFRHALIDRIRRDRKRQDRFIFLDGELDKGEEAAEWSGSTVETEAGYVVEAAGLELVEIFRSSLSSAEQMTLCDYLNRSHGDRGKTGFLDDTSEAARFKRVSRLKQKLADLSRTDPAYRPYTDPEAWRAAFVRFQSEICPGLRSDRTNRHRECSS